MTLNVSSHFRKNKEEAVAVCEEARTVLAGLGALELKDLNAASTYRRHRGLAGAPPAVARAVSTRHRSSNRRSTT
jgi:hypothetical protein